MKIKKEYIILAVIIVALSVYLVMRRGDRTLYELPQMPQISQNEITRLEITKGKTLIGLNKKDNSWYIAPKEYPADAGKVKNMLDPSGIMNPKAWPAVSGSAIKALKSMPLPADK